MGLVVAVVCIGTALPVAGFAPTNVWTFGGFFGTSHERITREAVEALASDFYGSSGPSKPLRKAIQEIADGNAEVDEDQESSGKHFDGENSKAGMRARIRMDKPSSVDTDRRKPSV